MAQETRVGAHKKRIDRVVTYIHENLDAPLDMDVLGEIACLSPHHWHRIYREIMGETASQTVRRRRLWRAAHQLLNTPDSIEQVARVAHYSSTAAFTTDGIITPETKGIAVFFDDPTQKPPEELTSLAAIPRPEGKEPGEGTQSYTIPGGPHAIARHVGPYTELARTYTELFQNWLPASGEARNGAPLFEINMNDPKTTAPADLITDIYVPLK